MRRHSGRGWEGGEAGVGGGGGGRVWGLVLCDDSEALISLQLLVQLMRHAHCNCQVQLPTCMTNQLIGAMQVLNSATVQCKSRQDLVSVIQWRVKF